MLHALENFVEIMAEDGRLAEIGNPPARRDVLDIIARRLAAHQRRDLAVDQYFLGLTAEQHALQTLPAM